MIYTAKKIAIQLKNEMEHAGTTARGISLDSGIGYDRLCKIIQGRTKSTPIQDLETIIGVMGGNLIDFLLKIK